MAKRHHLSDEADEALKHIEEALSRLDVKWKLFFMGSAEQRHPPDRETEDLARQIRQLPTQYPLRARHHFKHTNLAHRFYLLRERWNKWMRLMEEQGPHAVMQALGIRPSSPPSSSPRPSPRASYDHLYRAYVQACRRTGRPVLVDYARFQALIKACETKIRKKVGSRPLEYSVIVENGRPKIKVRVRR